MRRATVLVLPTTDDRFLQIRHLNRRECCFKSLVAHLQARAVNGLFQRVAGEDAECVGDSRLLRRLADPTCDFVDDDVIMRRISAQQAAEADDCVVFAGLRKRARGRRNLEGAGNADNVNVLVLRPGAQQPIVCASQQAIRDEFVKSRNDDGKAQAGSIQLSRTRLQPNFGFGRVLRVSVSLW